MAAGTYRTTLTRPGLWPFLWTQFLGAFNDNVFKIVVIAARGHGAGPRRDGAASSLAGAVFIAPFLLFSGYAGHLADASASARVLVAMKIFEIVAMALGHARRSRPADSSCTCAVLFLMGAQATFFSPAKYGIVPGDRARRRSLARERTARDEHVSSRSSLGTAIGGPLFVLWRDRPWLDWRRPSRRSRSAARPRACGIPRVPRGAPVGPHRDQPVRRSLARGRAAVARSHAVDDRSIGISYFWFLGALLQMALPLFGQHALHVADAEIAAAHGARRRHRRGQPGRGTAVGRQGRAGPRADRIDRDGRVRVCCSRRAARSRSRRIALALIGFFGGLFAVPLNALLQQKPALKRRAACWRRTTFSTPSASLLASATLTLLGDVARHVRDRRSSSSPASSRCVSSIYVLALAAGLLHPVLAVAADAHALPDQIVGRPNIPQRGPALLICNHVSMIDGALVGACVQRFVRFMVYGPYYRSRSFTGLLRLMHAIPVTAGQPARGRRGDRARARQSSAGGHVVCIFAEGAVSRTGNLLPFKRGFERIVHGLDVPDHAGLSRSRLGQHLQLQGRASSSGSCRSGCRIRSRSRSARRCRRRRRPPRRGWRSWSSAPRRCGASPAGRPTAARPQFVRSREAALVALLRWPTATGQPLTLRPRAGRRPAARSRWIAPADAGRGAYRPAAAGVGRRRAREHRDDPGRQGAGQPQLHGRAAKRWRPRSTQCGIRRSSRRAVSCEGVDRADGRDGVPRRRAQDVRRRREGRHAR